MFFPSYKSKSGDKNDSKDACDTPSGLEAVLCKAENRDVNGLKKKKGNPRQDNEI